MSNVCTTIIVVVENNRTIIQAHLGRSRPMTMAPQVSYQLVAGADAEESASATVSASTIGDEVCIVWA